MTAGGDPDNRLFNLYFAKYRLYFFGVLYIISPLSFFGSQVFLPRKYKNIAR